MHKNLQFPIKSASACLNKWTWSTIWLQSGTTASCHRIVPEEFDVADFDNFHNTAEKIHQRETMMRGEWPTKGCEYCERIETAGGRSDRLEILDQMGYSDFVPPEFETNLTATTITPRIVEIFINNTCNLKCLYCSSALSSSIEKENLQYGELPNPFNPHLPLIYNGYTMVENRTDYVDAFFSWLSKHYDQLKRLHVLGGEPFLQSEFLQVIEFFKTHSAPDLDLNIITNLMVKERNIQKYIDELADCVKIGNINGLYITASIDSWGPGAEHVRHGLNLETFEKNLLYVINNPKVFSTGIFQVLTCMTIKESVALYKKVIEWREIRPDFKYNFQFNTDASKGFMDPRNWGAEPWAKDFEELIDLMTEHNDPGLREMIGIWTAVKNSTPDVGKINTCYLFLDEIDRRRGTNWRELFPYLLV